MHFALASGNSDRRKEEEAAEEARLAREQERMRLQFDADQAQQRSKKAAKVVSGGSPLCQAVGRQAGREQARASARSRCLKG